MSALGLGAGVVIAAAPRQSANADRTADARAAVSRLDQLEGKAVHAWATVAREDRSSNDAIRSDLDAMRRQAGNAGSGGPVDLNRLEQLQHRSEQEQATLTHQLTSQDAAVRSILDDLKADVAAGAEAHDRGPAGDERADTKRLLAELSARMDLWKRGGVGAELIETLSRERDGTEARPQARAPRVTPQPHLDPRASYSQQIDWEIVRLTAFRESFGGWRTDMRTDIYANLPRVG